jgi:RND family efflux transporter MFP subunit
MQHMRSFWIIVMKFKGKQRGLVILPFLVGLAATGLTGCNEAVPVAATKPTPVRVAVVKVEPLIETRRYVGVIRPRFESDLGFRVAGKIVERRVDLGSPVKAGDVIARIDATDFALSRQSQQAELAAAKSSRDQAVAAAERYRVLLEKGHVAPAAFEQRSAAADEARSRVERAEKSLELATNQIAYAELKADHAGVVSALPVEVGQVVAAGQTVMRLARNGEREAVVSIPESRLGELSAADAMVELWAGNAPAVSAKLREVSPEADKASRTYQARFSLGGTTMPSLGMTATVVLRASSNDAVARIPLAAVMNDGKGAAVWVVDAAGQKIERRAVEVASFGQGEAVISKGLASGDRVVSLGVHVLDPQTHIRIVETTASNGQPTSLR